jgi:glycosyltransferase involved in cell wall biosynthesis
VPFTSVIIPCFNAAHTLERAVRSCLAQPEAAEIIVVDDASTDASAQVAARLASQNARVKLLRMRRNSGPAAARNWGARHASQRFLSFLDSDDEYLTDALKAALAHLRYHPLRPAVCLDVDFYGFPAEIVRMPAFAEQACKFSNTVPSALTIRSAFFRKLGGFPEDDIFRRLGSEDYVLQEAISRISPHMRLADQKRVRMHFHPNSHVAQYFWQMKGVLPMTPDNHRAICEAIEYFLGNIIRAMRLCYNRSSPPRSVATAHLLLQA